MVQSFFKQKNEFYRVKKGDLFGRWIKAFRALIFYCLIPSTAMRRPTSSTNSRHKRLNLKIASVECGGGFPAHTKLALRIITRFHWLQSKGMAFIQDAVFALLARAVFWRSSQGKRLGVDRLTGGRPPMTISARR